MLLSFVIPLLIAILSGMGVGGGGLFVIYLSLFTDVPQLSAQGMNLLFFLFSASASLLFHLTHRRLYPTLILLLALTAIPGALLGSFAAQWIGGDLLRKLFGMMLVITGIFSLKQKPAPSSKENTPEKSRRP